MSNNYSDKNPDDRNPNQASERERQIRQDNERAKSPGKNRNQDPKKKLPDQDAPKNRSS